MLSLVDERTPELTPGGDTGIAVGVIMRSTGDVLAIYRQDAPKGWALPGGHVDHGETFEDAAMREVYEETGIRTSAPQFVTALAGNKEGRYEVRFYVLAHVEGELRPSSEGVPAWVPWAVILAGPYGRETTEALGEMVAKGLI
jgi:8-oxo-dGTP diphosphatase